MVSQYKTVSIFILFIYLFFYSEPAHSQQLALPNSDILEIGIYKIFVKDFVDCYSDYFFSFSIKDNIIAHRSILNNMIGECLLLDNVTLSIITKIGFLNNQFYLAKRTKT